MSKSKIFEKELREKNILTRTSLVRRTSLTDTYNKKSAFQRPNFPKIKKLIYYFMCKKKTYII